MESIVRFENVSYSYASQEVLSNLSFSIQKGEYLAVSGPNGGGKSTLVKLILGLLRPKEGKIEIFSEEIENFNKKFLIGYVPQRISQSFPYFPIAVFEVILSGLVSKIGLLRRFSKRSTQDAEAVMDLLGISHLRKRMIAELSGGERQKVFIARALVADPKLLILDEPSTGVDQPYREQFYSFLKDVNHKKELTIVLVSHDIDVVSKDASALLCLNRYLVSHGSPKDALNSDMLEKLYGKHVHFVPHEH